MQLEARRNHPSLKAWKDLTIQPRVKKEQPTPCIAVGIEHQTLNS